MTDSENKIAIYSSLSIQNIYQCYSNRNHPLNYNLCDYLFYPSFIVMSDGKGSTKNKFELDRPDLDSHANHAERYSI